MVVIIPIIPVMLCQRFGVGPSVLFHNTFLARCDCVNVGTCELCCTSPSLLHGANVGSNVGSPPAWSPTAPRAPLYPHGLCGQCQALATLQEMQRSFKDGRPGTDSLLLAKRLGEREHLPPGRVLAWCVSLLCPRAMSVSSNSGQLEGPDSGKEPELGGGRAGMRQLHHGGSLQPPCGCSLSAQAQTSLKLIPPQSLGLLGLLSSGHRNSLNVHVVLLPRAVAFCEVFPCGSTRLSLDGRTPLWGGEETALGI